MSNLFINQLIPIEDYQLEWENFFAPNTTYDQAQKQNGKLGLAIKPNDVFWYLREIENKVLLSSGQWGTKQSFANRLITTTQSEHLYSSSFWKKFSANRCLIPVTAYFEWQMQMNGKKHKFKIEFKDKKSYFGGIWGPLPESMTWVTILTQTANAKTAEIHNYGDNKHRQPIVIRKENQKLWLNSNVNSELEVKKLITQFKEDDITTEDFDYEQTLFD
ncbi:DUF159 family protein [Leptospira sp. mixed culture ATI2-C-A1]|nr:DUF159 family protein [Leptospira sp. mixed culture ATI2-C-A1]